MPKSGCNLCVCVRRQIIHLIPVCLRVFVDGKLWSISVHFKFYIIDDACAITGE